MNADELQAAVLRHMQRTVEPLMTKYGNKRVTEDNYTFDSLAERSRYRELKLLERAGEVTGIRVHPRFMLHTTNSHGERIEVGSYAPDFWYCQVGRGQVYEDVKSPATKTPLYRLKKRMFEAEYGVTLTEVEA